MPLARGSCRRRLTAHLSGDRGIRSRRLDSLPRHGSVHPHVVPESRFGVWFISSEIWSEYVLRAALDDLERLIPHRVESYPTILDFGCGFGLSFQMLHHRFRPRQIVAIDCDRRMLAGAHLAAQEMQHSSEVLAASGIAIPLRNQSVDMIFCHQTLHHVVDQKAVLAEFYRVLKPGGLLLFAESTEPFITSWIIRLLFRHPKESQWKAAEYLAMIRNAGFTVTPMSVSYPYLWWSRKDFGLKEYLFGLPLRPQHAETLINLVAVRD